MNTQDLYRAIAGATARMQELTGTAFDSSLRLEQRLEELSEAKGDKPIPKRKRRYYANAEKRAEARWNGAEKLLKLLAPAGVQSGPRAMDALTRKYGI